MIQHPLEIPRAIHEAFHIARTGRPGPVVVDIPQDLSRAEIDYEPVTDVAPARLPADDARATTKQIRQAAKALAAARRPVIYAGGGVVNAQRRGGAARSSRRADRFPVTCTLMGLGAFPAPHPQWLGMLGMHGTRAANYAMDEADLICCDRRALRRPRHRQAVSEFAPRAKFIHIDIDPAEISKNVPAHIPIVGDAKNVLAKLVVEYRALEPDRSRLEEWWQRIDELARAPPARLRGQRRHRDQAAVRDPGAVRGDRRRRDRHAPTSASTRCGRRSTTTSTSRAGGSTRAAWARWASACRPRWAPQVGCPDETVVLHHRRRLGADERAGARDVRRRTASPIKVFIMNNGYLGMVRQWQELFWDRRYSHVDMGRFPDFVKLAEAYGATGMRFTDKTTLVDDIRAALATDGPVIVDVRVTAEENVYPMIAPGAPARDMVG